MAMAMADLHFHSFTPCASAPPQRLAPPSTVAFLAALRSSVKKHLRSLEGPQMQEAFPPRTFPCRGGRLRNVLPDIHLKRLRKTEVQKATFPSCVLQRQSLGRGTGRGRSVINVAPVSTKGSNVDTEEWNQQARDSRLEHLEAQAIETLKKTVESFERPAFPCALIAGDVVILDLLHRIGALSDEKVKIIFIDTFHLFPETHQFLSELEKRYGFKAHTFHAADVNSKEEYNEKFGSDLFLTNIEEYDRICKVEPFTRSLKTLEVDAMINGRRRDHGAERAHLEVFEGGNMAKVQPLAYWEFRDCWDYLKKYSIPYHPLHDQGFPSIGDVQTTLPVAREKWFEYAGERSGRFQGLKNPDGSEKTECGIHTGGRS